MHERVPIPLLFFVAVLCPAILIAIYTLFIDSIFSRQRTSGISPNGWNLAEQGNRRPWKDRLWELNCGLLGLILASSSAFVITGALKNATGKPRPDLIARCLPLLGSADPPVFGLSNSTICTQKNHAILKDGFRSFPSGHSSCKFCDSLISNIFFINTDRNVAAFGGLFYLSLYLAGKLHVLDQRGQVWKCFIVLIPSLGAALVAISRIMDARHHPFDVITGSLLGILTAFCAYRQYFPPVSEAWRQGRAYPIRSWGTEPLGPPHDEREIIRDRGVEPLRMPATNVDEEQSMPASTTNHETSNRVPSTDLVPDVFHRHLSGAEHNRHQDFGAPHIAPSSNNSATFNSQNSANPFTTSSHQRGRLTHNDGYSSSVLSDHGDDEDGFELQIHEPETEPHYTLSDSQSQMRSLPYVHTAYNPHP